MGYDPTCAAYWCDLCGHECTIDWHDSGATYLVLKCPQCKWSRGYVDPDDLTITEENINE